MIIVELVKLLNQYKKIKKFVEDNKNHIVISGVEAYANLREVVKQIEETYGSLKNLLKVAMETLKRYKEEV